MKLGSVRVSRSAIAEELKGFAENQLAQQKDDAARKTMEGRLYGKTKVASKSYSPELVAFLLNNRMVNAAIHGEAVAEKVTVAPLDAATRTRLVADYGGDTLFAKLPADFQKGVENSAKEFNALVKAQTDKLGTPEAYFKANAATFAGETCVSHILVATLPAANAVLDRIAKGEDFAKVAADVSTDPGSKSNGGALPCGDPAQYVTEFATAARTQKIGALSKPVQTQFGFHIIKVTKRTVATFESSKAKVTADLQTKGQQGASKKVVARLKVLKVSVDPSLAVFVPNGSRGFPEIVSAAAAKAAITPAAGATTGASTPTTSG